MTREVEIKYLLTDKSDRDRLVEAVREIYSQSKKTKSSIVLSYFYEPVESVSQLLAATQNLLEDVDFSELKSLLENSEELVVKSRSIDDVVYFAVKGASRGEDAVHAISRIEFETEINDSLEAVNGELVSKGLKLASKWSSKRDYFELENGIEMNIEFVSGYGYKAELEILTEDDEVESIISKLRGAADKLGLTEANQQLFGRMYKYYNAHWEEYFNTDKIFPDEVWSELGR